MKIVNKQLAQTILRMYRQDRAVRAKAHKTRVWDSRIIADLDRTHTKVMKQIFRVHGWPTVSLVGTKASYAAWLLVQHADKDIHFQKRCVVLMEKALEQSTKDVRKDKIAQLSDRILVNEGKKQLYGTQWHYDSRGIFKPKPICDIGNIEKRRKEYGMEPFKKFSRWAKENPSPRLRDKQ